MKAYENLCYYDKRNPNNILDEEWEITKPEGPCFCDNCFYGRTPLAEEIIKLTKELDEVTK